MTIHDAHDPDDSLADAAAFQIGVAVPGPLSVRLDALVERAHRSGERTNRKELLAALILSAPESETALSRLVRRYRRARIADAVVAGEDPASFLNPERPRGPRRAPGTRLPPLRRRRRPLGGPTQSELENRLLHRPIRLLAGPRCGPVRRGPVALETARAAAGRGCYRPLGAERIPERGEADVSATST